MARPDDFDTVYLDSCAILHAINKNPGSEVTERVLEQISIGKLKLLVATASLIEVRGAGRGEPIDPEVEEKILEIFAGPSITLVELDRLVALKARELGIAHGLKTWDAVHLASAIVGGAQVLMTDDEKDFKRLIGQSIDGVYVSRPFAPGGPDLFAQG